MIFAVDAQGGLGLYQLVIRQSFGGERHAERGVRLIVVFTGHHALRLELARPVVVDTGLAELRLGEREARACGLDLRVKLVDRLARALELGFGGVDLDLVVARVELEQRVAGLDPPVVLDEELDHGAGDARGDEPDGTVDVGVVGGDVGIEIAVVTDSRENGCD